LFTTNVRPRRRTTIEPGRTFSPRSEFLTFMIYSLAFSAPVTTSSARSFRPARRVQGHRGLGSAGGHDRSILPRSAPLNR
jgi:hypothetical protein